MKKIVVVPLVALSAGFTAGYTEAQDINANFFSHIELTNSDAARASDREAAWGESALFLTGNLSDKLSFLAESTFQAQEYREDQLTLERIRLRYELNRDHAISIGKMHTPVNYWNDSYHHGRFFYPTINRPLVFGRFIPVHEAGIRLSGQPTDITGFGYDVVLGTGQSEGDDLFARGVKSYTASLTWTPNAELTTRMSYYRDEILDHLNNPFHSHGGHHGMDDMGHGHMDDDHEMHDAMGDGNADIPYEMLSWSAYWDSGDWRALTELSANRTDSGDWNQSAFQYPGRRLTDSLMAYLLLDYVNVGDDEIHFASGIDKRMGVGLEWFARENISVKSELRSRHAHTDGHRDDTEIQVQISFGF